MPKLPWNSLGNPLQDPKPANWGLPGKTGKQIKLGKLGTSTRVGHHSWVTATLSPAFIRCQTWSCFHKIVCNHFHLLPLTLVLF